MEYTTLDKICENLDSQRQPITGSDRVEGSIPYYGASGVVDYVQDYIFDERLLLVSEDGANLLARSTPIAFSIEGKTWVNNHAHVLRFADDIRQKYVEIYLNSISLEPYITGSAQPKLNQKMLNEIPIPVVDWEAMKLVVDAAEQVNQIISIRKKELEELDNLIQARFVELFGDPVTNEKNWPRLTLGDVCEIGSSKRVFEKDYVPNGIPFFRTKEIVELSKGNSISTELFITEKHFAELKKCYGAPKKDDLLISAVGTIGTIWIVNGDFEFYFKDGNLIQIKASSNFNSIFMKCLLNELIANYKNEMSTGTAYSALTIAGLKSMLVYDVPLALQEQFADFVKQVDKSKAAVQKALDEAQILFDSLMQKYFG